MKNRQHVSGSGFILGSLKPIQRSKPLQQRGIVFEMRFVLMKVLPAILDAE